MRQFVDDDHSQKGFRRVAKHGGDADLGFRFQLAALYARDRCVQAERILQHVDLIVIHHFVDRRGVTQKLIFQILGVLPERFIRREIMRSRIALFQHRAQPLLGNQRAHLRKQVLRVALEVS